MANTDITKVMSFTWKTPIVKGAKTYRNTWVVKWSAPVQLYYFRTDGDIFGQGGLYLSQTAFDGYIEQGYITDVKVMSDLSYPLVPGRLLGYKHSFTCSWVTITRYARRTYSREYATLEEAVTKARQVKEKNPLSEQIRVSESESYDTDAPAPNGTHHSHVLRWNIDWWTGFLPWWELER